MKVRTRITDALGGVARVYSHLMRYQEPDISLGDVQFVVGFGALIYGVSLLSVPGAWMLAGALLLVGWSIPRMRALRREKE